MSRANLICTEDQPAEEMVGWKALSERVQAMLKVMVIARLRDEK